MGIKITQSVEGVLAIYYSQPPQVRFYLQYLFGEGCGKDDTYLGTLRRRETVHVAIYVDSNKHEIPFLKCEYFALDA